MQPDFISLTVGGCILTFGVLLAWLNWKTWAWQQQEFIDDPRELRHLQARFRRRTQTSGLIALVGLLIPLGDLPLVWKQHPVLSSILWIAICCVCFWIMLLALADLVATRSHSRATLLRLQAHKGELLDQLKRLRPDASADEIQKPLQ